MNFLQRWIARALPPPQPVTWETVFGTEGYALSGVDVTEMSSLRHSPVWCGVTTLAADVARVPLNLYKVLPNGGKIPFRAHRTFRVLHDRANPEMTSYKFRETMQALCVLYGNAYAEIVRNDLGQVVGLYPIIPTRVTPVRDRESGRLFYRVQNPSGGQSRVSPANLIHLSSISFDGIIGESLVSHGSESIGLGLAAQKFGESFFGNGATFGGVVESPLTFAGPEGKKLKDDIRDSIQAIHAGVERAHKILVIGAGSKFTPRGTAPNEAQFLETREFQVREVARWLKMPPHKLQDYKDAHFTNVEHSEISYWKGCVGAWFKMWEQELSSKLISPLEYEQQSIGFNMNAEMRGDSAARSEFYSKLFSVGALSVNDILSLEDMNPIGPSGDLHLVPLNMVPIERYDEVIDAEIASKKAPPTLPAATDDDDTRAIQAKLDAMQAERDAAIIATEQAAAQRAEAEQRAADADAARLVAEHTAEEHRAEVRRAAEQVASALSQREALEVRGMASEQAKADAEADVLAARTELAERQSVLTQAQSEAEAARAEANTTRERADELAAQLEQRKESELKRLTRAVTAHRTLIADVVQRLLRPEVDRARRRQSTPENLKRWAEAFYQTHREVCADAFYPAILTHLAWKGSDEDARTVAQRLASEHCDESVRQIDALIEVSEPEEFHPALERMLLKWEQERPHTLADKVLTDEIEYIRSFV